MLALPYGEHGCGSLAMSLWVLGNVVEYTMMFCRGKIAGFDQRRWEFGCAVRLGWTTNGTFLPARSIQECLAASQRQLHQAIGQYNTVSLMLSSDSDLSQLTQHDALVDRDSAGVRKRGLPRVSDDGWLRFNSARRSVRMEMLRFDAGERRLKFHLTAEQSIEGVSLVLPAALTGFRISHPL
jgi:hypothetical protein